jgi:hypothetical protein
MKTPPPTDAELAELIAYLPRLYAPGFMPILRWGGGKRTADGALTMPYPVYDALVDAFFGLAAQPCWCDYGYNPLEAQRMIADAAFIRRATLDQIKTMLTYCVRGERFCDGHWGAMIEQGVIRVLLERLGEIQAGR